MSRSATLLLVLALAGLALASARPQHHRRRGHHDAKSHHAVVPPVDLPSEVNATTVDAAFAAWRSSLPNGGVFGLDVSNPVTSDQFHCLTQAGYSFAIVRAWRSLCSADPNAKATVAAAHAGGMRNVDVYLFPARTCAKSAKQQVSETVSMLSGSSYGMLWFDIEASGSNWSSDTSVNVAWLQEAVETAVELLGQGRIGIYTSHNNWSQVMGGNGQYGSFPVWYAHYDSNPSFSDWTGFGGWSNPSIKQFADGPSVCGVSMDHNWYSN